MIVNLLLSLSLSIFSLNAFSQNELRYNLPITKASIEPCQQKALERHPGRVFYRQIIQHDSDFVLVYSIDSGEFIDWTVVCNGLTAEILQEFKIDLQSYHSDKK